jgi:hypothetical protein
VPLLISRSVSAARSCYFGTFLYNCDRERTTNKVREQTLSFWDHVLDNRDTYTNHLFSPAMQVRRGFKFSN